MGMIRCLHKRGQIEEQDRLSYYNERPSQIWGTGMADLQGAMEGINTTWAGVVVFIMSPLDLPVWPLQKSDRP